MTKEQLQKSIGCLLCLLFCLLFWAAALTLISLHFCQP